MEQVFTLKEQAIRQIFTLLVMLGLAFSASAQSIIFVDQSATGTADGSSWANAYTDLQSAIDAAALLASAATPAQVWVKADTYKPGTNRADSYTMANNVEVYGGFVGTETNLTDRDFRNNMTILSGNIGAKSDSLDNSYRLIGVGNNITDITVLDGFHVISAYGGGGAIQMTGTANAFEVRNCEIYYNYGLAGSAISASSVSNSASQLTVVNSIFHHNGTTVSQQTTISAIYSSNVLRVYNSLFYKNEATYGAAILAIGGSIDVVNCTFTENTTSTTPNRTITAQNLTFLGLSNSVFWNNSPSNSYNYYNSVGAFNVGNNLIDIDPLFADPANEDYRISQCSPATDIGNNSRISSYTEDILGNPRTYNTTVDAGAYENQFDPLSFAAVEIQDVSCFGQSNGQLAVNGGGGSGVIEYSIDGTNFSANSTFTSLAAGAYTVTLRDAGNGCTYSEQYTIIEPTALNVTYSSENISCKNNNDGKVTVTVTGGSSPYETFVNGTGFGQFVGSQEVDQLFPTTYSLQVVDAGGCIFSTSGFTITEPDTLIASSTPTDVNCNGETTGSLQVGGTGGTSPYTYSLNATDFQSASIFSGLSAGNYVVTIMDAQGCLNQVNDTIRQPSALSNVAVSLNHVSCSGGNDGSFSMEGIGGTMPYTYSLDGTNFQSSPLWENLEAGTYNYTIKDANDCLFTGTQVINEPATIGVSLAETNTSSCGLSDGTVTITASGGTSPYQYSLDGGTVQASNVFTGLSAGGYSIEVIDANNCTRTASAIISDPVTAAVAVDVVNVSCKGGNDGELTVNVTGGTAPLTYSINNGAFQSGNIFSGLTASAYRVTIKEANGCTQAQVRNVTEPDTLVFTTAINDVLCYGESTGSISVSATGGAGGFNYSLNGGSFQLSGVFENLSSGTYTVLVEDQNGCSQTDDVTVTQTAELTTTAVVVDALCDGGLGGISLSASGGTGIYTYTLDTMQNTTGEFDALPAGVYEFEIMDGNNCLLTVSYTVNEPEALAANVATQATSSCGVNDGSLEVTTTGGTPPYSYSLDMGTAQNSNIFTGLAADDYSVQVTDANGCELTVTGTVSAPTPAVIALTTTKVTCFDGADGVLTITTTGGTAPIQYSLDGGISQDTAQNITGLEAGNYTLLVTEDNGCTQEIGFTIQSPDELILAEELTNVTCFGGHDGVVHVEATGGTGSLSYSLDNSVSQSTGTFTGLEAGTYSVTVEDTQGCQVTGSYELLAPAEIMATVSIVDASCEGNADGRISVSASGGTGALSYTLDNQSPQNNPDFDNLAAGTYTITVTDSLGCAISITNVEVIATVEITAAITTEAVVCFGEANGSLAVEATGGTAPYLYNLNNGGFQSGGMFEDLGAGTYDLVIEDVNGCQSSTQVEISEPDAIAASFITDSVSCFGGTDGQIEVMAVGGVGSLSYSLDEGTYQDSPLFTALAAGSYVLHVQDTNSCQYDSTIVIAEPVQLTATASVDGNVVTISASGGTPPYLYGIGGANLQESNIFATLDPGEYDIVVSDANDCGVTVSVTVELILGASDAESKVTIYPVPTTRMLNLINIAHATLQDLSGKTVLNIEGSQVDLETIPEGIYILIGSDSKGRTFTTRVIKE